MPTKEYCVKMKILVSKFAYVDDNITEKDLLMRISNGLGPIYLDLTSIITANKMSYDDAYALLLTREARFEQNQNAKAMFNANYNMINANHSHMRKTLRRGPYGGGTGLLFYAYTIGFPASSSNFGVYYRGQAMQIY